MKKSMKYICMFLMLLGIQVSAWGTTTSSTVILPAGSTTYNANDWRKHYAPCAYSETERTETICISDGNGYSIKFYHAADYSQTNGMQIEKNEDGYIEMTINSSNGVDIVIGYVSNGNSFDVTLTGASKVTAPSSSSATTTTIKTTSTSATLKINGTSNVVYISYIQITPKSSGTITIDDDACTLGTHVSFEPKEIEYDTEEYYGEISDEILITGVNIPDYTTINYDVFDVKKGGVSSDDCIFYVLNSSSRNYTYVEDATTFYETLTLTYYADAEGTYTAKVRAYTEDAYDNKTFLNDGMAITLTYGPPCTSRSITMSNFSKDFGSADFVPTHTVSAGEGTKTWTSSNTDVATIVAGEVHIVASGTTTIGLTVATDDTYCEVSQSCTMTVNALVPTVTAFTGTSSSPTSITLTNAQVSNKGGAAISAYGYVYSTTASTAETLKLGETGVSTATVASADIAASTNFASKTVSGLTTGTTYYVRAYATNSAGTGYSAVQSVKTIEYTDYTFSCAELTLTPKLITASTPIFVTSSYSATNKTVRSQDSILVHGSGLTPNAQVVFTAGSKFEVKSYKNDTIHTAADGTIDRYVYIFYTPSGSETADGLDKLTGITASVGGAKPRQVSLTQDIYGRHLPADFVIACKRGSKWYALPDTMTVTGTPKPMEIAVDNIDNPSIAYTTADTKYSLEGPATSNLSGGVGQYAKLVMTSLWSDDSDHTKGHAPLFGSATKTAKIGKSSNAQATNPLSKGYWWQLIQKNTSITNPQDAKYQIYCANNDTTLSLKENAGDPIWGLYKSGIDELRIIPASESTVVFAEASVVAWGKKGAIIEAKKPYDVNAFYIVGKLPGGIKSDTIELRETRTSKGSGTGTRYNYTVDFGSDFDFSAKEGQMLTLEWFNGSKVLKAVSNVTVPRIVASNTTINSTNYPTKSVWNTEVHVLPGDTLTIDASGYSTKNKDVTIKELNIYPGAAVLINTDTLKVTNLVLRSGWSRIGEKRYAVGSLYINPGSGNGSLKATNAYMDWYIDYDQYYPIAVPWKVATSSISYKNMVVDIDQGLIVRYYDGERHAKGGDGTTNWKQYSWATNMPEYLVPGIGYAITARRPAGKAFSIIRMPLTIPSADWTKNGEQGEVSSVHKDQVSVTAWVKDEGETPKHAKGWNFIANPYMCNYKGDITHEDGDEYDIAYVNIPDVNFKEFDQVEIGKATLKPGSGFLIQTEKTGTLTFGTGNRKVKAPSFLAEVPKVSKQKAYITLSGDDAEDEMGLIISERYTAEYEINADLEKLLSDGNTLRTYMIYNNINMAYVAINEELAKEWIPVTVRIPATGEYTFSLHEASKVSELEGIYLIDYSNNVVTNLIENNYSFMATEGTIAGRFAINAIVGKHDTPTDIDIIHAGGDIKSNQPFKFIYNDKVFILHNGVIYDSTGKKVREIKK